MAEDRIFVELREVESSVASAKARLEDLEAYIEDLKRDIVSQISKRIEEARYTRFNPELLPDFLAEPYLTMPKREERGRVVEWYVIVPRFIDFQLGWLERSTKSFNVFIVNQYVRWFAEIPKELEQKFRVKPLPLKVADGLLLTDEEHQEEAWKRYKRYLSRREGSQAIRIKRGSEFQLIAQIIEDGSLPFTPRRVEYDDLREPETEIELRDYQVDAWKRFLECGAVGVYWPFGTGKSLFGVYACAALKGRKLVVVPTRTLKEQWVERLHSLSRIPYEVQVETYRAFHRVRDQEYTLVIYDECNHLPANTFIRLATLNTKYRMGFSGSPYREDGRVNYIIALTGYPIGLAWEKFFELGIIRKPSITLYVLKTLRDKIRKLDELLRRETGKTLIFCDGIDLGQRIAREHDLPFVFGETTRRLEKIRDNEVLVISRVGDEGISIPEIDTLIEVDFLYGSRWQESQRSGRLLHSEREATNHLILMTEEELERYGKRLLALYERGYRIKVVR
ncbi:MAG: DEAD/DEAH box helicase [Candidatus Bathyarchaeia archaeon]